MRSRTCDCSACDKRAAGPPPAGVHKSTAVVRPASHTASMLTFLSGLGLIASMSVGVAQGPANRPPDPAPAPRVAAACCGASAVPAPPQPQGTNKGLLTEPPILTSLV